MTGLMNGVMTGPEHVIVLLAWIGIWPLAIVVLLAVALALTPRRDRVAAVRALAELVRAARSRTPRGRR